MRLRFFRIKNYPPFNDTSITFSAESPLNRECAIHFVVGVNGSGKTHLLQALTETFIALARKQPPHFPVTLIYELRHYHNNDRRTVIFDHTGNHKDVGWWMSNAKTPLIPSHYGESDWLALIDQVRNENVDWIELIKDSSWPGERVGLPEAVLAYTTGEDRSWRALFYSKPSTENVDIVSQSYDYDTSIERPACWNRKKEIEYQEKQATLVSIGVTGELQKLEEETKLRERDQDVCLLITPILLKFALLAVTLPLAMDELRQYETEHDISAFIAGIKEHPDEGKRLRRLLSQVGWIWPVSVLIEVDFQTNKRTKTQSDLMVNLFYYATSVVREPEPGTVRRLFFDLKEKTHADKRIDQPDSESLEYAGDELLDFLGGRSANSYDYFKLLLDMHKQGLIKNIHFGLRMVDSDEILLFDELSDGEQMYLCRMALFHLMKGRHDALILLDEPETHFNDKWKREIVDIIDEALKDTANDVLISTHSSIALTDVFNDEIVLFEKSDGTAHRASVTSTTFGADPSEIMINVFKTPDSIGKRSLEWLNAQLVREWTPEQKAELEKVIRSIGPGLHRAELRTIWRKLNAS